MRLPAASPPAHRALRRVCLASGVLLVLISLAPAAANAADDESDADDAVRPQATAGHGIGLSGSPRVTRVDLAVSTPSTVLAGVQNLQPDSARLSDISYRFWISRGRADLGVGVGALALTAQPLGAAPSAAPNTTLDNSTILLASAPSLTVGMRFRASPESTLFADASSTRGFGPDNGDAYLGKVGIEWKPASLASRWNIAYGGIGWRLSADSRMTLRIRGGGLGLYMRSQF
jgi:hypothetical protein